MINRHFFSFVPPPYGWKHETLIAALSASLVALTTVALFGCNPNSVIVQRKPTPTALIPTVDEQPPIAGTAVDNSDGIYSLSFALIVLQQAVNYFPMEIL